MIQRFGATCRVREESLCVVFPYVLQPAYLSFLSMLLTEARSHSFPFQRCICRRFKSFAISFAVFVPCAARSKIVRTQSTSLLGPGTRMVRSVFIPFRSPSCKRSFRRPSGDTVMRRSPYPASPATRYPRSARRRWPAETFIPSSRLYSAAIVLFRAFISELASDPSLSNCSAQ